MESSSSSREQQMQIVCVRSSPTAGGEEARELESSRSALSLFKEKEEEIERKKLEVREKVSSMLGRVEEETKRLAFIRQLVSESESERLRMKKLEELSETIETLY